ncbi:hypothetical protein LQ318_12755 [Aliifodinibius salicampi]|uniref:Uncharacterized protein n=1 Tax=Fodinibius salicampi TaxID=1920655 RepID=A0ABT3Q0X3_9BACT|nr:hypothetical protein [Fodinibius salicampi]MCW9713774.1 hypothetical protein [Fodinibius salicampi]
MFKRKIHIVQSIGASLIVAACFFCVLFGQGTHFHDFDIHIGNHFDLHAHVHAHESHEDEPFQQNADQDDHKHQVSTTSDIIGTLTSPTQVKPDIESFFVFSLDAVVGAIHHIELDDTPTLFDLPPPRPVASQYHLSSFSLRGPPMA